MYVFHKFQFIKFLFVNSKLHFLLKPFNKILNQFKCSPLIVQLHNALLLLSVCLINNISWNDYKSLKNDYFYFLCYGFKTIFTVISLIASKFLIKIISFKKWTSIHPKKYFHSQFLLENTSKSFLEWLHQLQSGQLPSVYMGQTVSFQSELYLRQKYWLCCYRVEVLLNSKIFYTNLYFDLMIDSI